MAASDTPLTVVRYLFLHKRAEFPAKMVDNLFHNNKAKIWRDIIKCSNFLVSLFPNLL